MESVHGDTLRHAETRVFTETDCIGTELEVTVLVTNCDVLWPCLQPTPTGGRVPSSEAVYSGKK